MSPVLRVLLLTLCGLFALPAAANSCYVTAHTSGAVPAPVNQEYCFEHRGTDNDSIDWACRDREDVRNARHEVRDSCPAGAIGTCTAALTPETLANERATGSQTAGQTLPTTVPETAQIVTHHYKVSDEAQAKVDCESAGGKWTQ